MLRWISRFFDLRDDEARPAFQAFVVLFLLIGAHTTLETARDALFLTKLRPRELNLVYIALAALSFVSAAASTLLSHAFGRRNALVVTLGISASTILLFYTLPSTPRVIMMLYVFSGLVGAVLPPQFWLLAAERFTSTQGRRLFGPIASGGVLGGVVGAGTAAGLLARFSVMSLLLAAAGAFATTALLLVVSTARGASGFASAVDLQKLPTESAEAAAEEPSEKPFFWRVALLVGFSTAALLTLDYLFKSTAARKISPAHLGEFFARYYAVMNGLSLVVQLLVAGRVVRRLGVAGATAVMPVLLLAGGVTSFFSFGGLLVPVLATRMVDGGLRHSLNRVATELLYLPMPTALRERAKSLIDTVLNRTVQAGMAGVLFALGTLGILSPRLLSAILVVLCAAWAVVAFSMRAQYIDLFRHALARGTLQIDPSATEIDLNAAEALVEAMASREPARVIAAMDHLEQKNRAKLIPALILYHDAEVVLFRALEIFWGSERRDWIPLAERLLTHPSETVRAAAIRALAKGGVTSVLARASEDESSTVQAYGAFHVALQSVENDLATHPLLAALLTKAGDFGDAARQMLLMAITDTPQARAASLVLVIAESPLFRRSEETITLVANAMSAIKAPAYIPYAIGQLARREGREAIRRTLLALGEPALAALKAAFVDLTTDRRIRMHIPRTIDRFGTQHAFDFLLAQLEQEGDGFIRYKLLRAVGRIVADHNVKVDRNRIDRQITSNLLEYLRMTAHRVGLERNRDTPAGATPIEQLLMGLLGDKQLQSLERVFRLLKIAHKREDIHRVHLAVLSTDRRERSNAGEFLDSLLSGRSRSTLRELFRLVADDLEPAERVARAATHLGPTPQTRQEVITSLANDHDEALATLASYYALSMATPDLQAVVSQVRKDRPALDGRLHRFLETALLPEATE